MVVWDWAMATRNLTKAFIQARSGGKANRSLLKAEADVPALDSDQSSDSGLLGVCDFSFFYH